MASFVGSIQIVEGVTSYPIPHPLGADVIVAAYDVDGNLFVLDGVQTLPHSVVLTYSHGEPVGPGGSAQWGLLRVVILG